MNRFSPRLRDPRTWAVLLLLIAAMGPAQAETPDDRGFEIAARSDRSDRGFGDSSVSLTMVLRNAAGRRPLERSRCARWKSRTRAWVTRA